MINLLPPEAKTNITYARRNRALARWCATVAVVVAVMGIVVVFGGFYIDKSKQSLQSSIAGTEEIIKNEKLADTQKEVKQLSDGIKTVVSILQKEIRFSKLLQQIGSVIPKKAVLTQITLSDKIDNALDLQARASDYDTATQVPINIQDPKNKIFDKVDIITVSCSVAANTSTANGTSAESAYLNENYPCTINLRATFRKDASFLFLNGPAKSTTGSTAP